MFWTCFAKKETDTTDTGKNSFSSDADPRLFVIYNDEQQIHAVLGLPSVNGITPQVWQSSTPAGSFINFIAWMDQICTQACSTSLVYWSAGTGQPSQQQPRCSTKCTRMSMLLCWAPLLGTMVGEESVRVLAYMPDEFLQLLEPTMDNA